jgi:hypothetical protein
VAVASVGGKYRVTASISASKFAYRGTEEHVADMSGELIDVAMLAGDGKVLYAGKHRVEQGRIAVTVDLAVKPIAVVVDPLVRRIDRERANNRRRID